MKIVFYPPKSAILGRLGHRLKESQEGLDKAKAALTDIEVRASETKLHNPYLSSELASAKSSVKAWEEAEAALQDIIGLIEGTSGDTVQAETEV